MTTRTNNEERFSMNNIERENARITVREISSVVQGALTGLGGSLVGAGVDIALGGDGYVGGSAGLASGVAVFLTRNYLHKMSSEVARGIYRTYRSIKGEQR